MQLLIVALLSAGCLNQGKDQAGPLNETTQPESSNASTTAPVTTLMEGETNNTTVESPGEMNESAEVEDTAPSTSTTLAKTNLPLNDYCETDTACESGCCASIGEGRRERCLQRSFCELRDMNEGECYLAGLYWCADRCKNDSCGECEKYMRCVYESGDPVVRVAEPVEGRTGSCNYSITYEAGGEGSYCDLNEGKLIYAVCGRSVLGEDCVKAYGKETLYRIAQKRSFHSPEGEGSDLWCFECSEAVQE